MSIAPPPPTPAEALAHRLRRYRNRARAVLAFERAWPAFWPAVGVIGAFLCLALLDLLPTLPPVLHIAILLLFAAGCGLFLLRALRAMVWPRDDEADRRLESASGLRHRPLAALSDRPALAGADGLWRAHVARAAAALKSLRVGWPHPGLARRDRRAVRGALFVALVAAIAIAGRDAPLRLGRAIAPSFAPPAAAAPTQLQAWITPPTYTGLAPLFLRPETPAISVPAGSHLAVVVTGGTETPAMVLAGHATQFRALDSASFQAETDLASGGRLEIQRHGAALSGWDIAVVANDAPMVSFPEPPGRARGNARVPATRLPWQVSHRYGVVSLAAELRLRDRPDAPPVVVAIPLPGVSVKSAKGARVQDLTADPWAGLPVVARLIAKDATGQAGHSEDATFELPERPFRNPAARALVSIRKNLSRDPTARDEAVHGLDQLSALTEIWERDPGAFVNLRAITATLGRNRAPEAVASAQARMWLLALHLEEGATDRTARELAQARQELRDMMERQAAGDKVDPAEIDKKMREVQEALQRHLEALAEQARRDPDAQTADPESRELDAREMQKLAEEARRAAQENKMDEARQKMAELDRMLGDLERARPEHGKMTERERQRAEKRERGRQQMNALQDIVKREGALLDRAQERDTARNATASPRSYYGSGSRFFQPPPPAGQSPADPQQDAKERGGEQRVQSALRRALGELMQQYGDLTGKVPPNLGDADTAMRDAGQALAEGRDGGAASAEQKVIEALQKGGQSMSMQMAQQFGRSRSPGEQGEQGDEGQDGDEGDQDGSGSSQMGSADQGDGGGQQWGRDNGRGTRPWEPHGRADRRADDRRDPLGRPLREGTAGSDESSDTAVPEKMEEARTRAIQDELRRRDSDRGRPQPELDYIERLLKRF